MVASLDTSRAALISLSGQGLRILAAQLTSAVAEFPGSAGLQVITSVLLGSATIPGCHLPLAGDIPPVPLGTLADILDKLEGAFVAQDDTERVPRSRVRY